MRSWVMAQAFRQPAFQRRRFSVKNTFRNEAEIKLVATLPEFLTKLGWRLEFVNPEGGSFRLAGGKKTEVLLSMHAGQDFSPELVKKNADDSLITITAYANGIVIGGMSYRVDPELKTPSGPDKDGSLESRPGCLRRIFRGRKR